MTPEADTPFALGSAPTQIGITGDPTRCVFLWTTLIIMTMAPPLFADLSEE
jgi:hypothetical protein